MLRANAVGTMAMAAVILLFSGGGRRVLEAIGALSLGLALLGLAVLVMGICAVLIVRCEESDG